MAFRHLYIANPASIYVRNQQLVIKQDGEYTVPLEDIATILIESKIVTITVATLSMLADRGILLFSCDNKHIPNGIWTSFNQHSRQLKVIESQLSMSKPLQKRIWQKIIRAKITNQAKALEYSGNEGAKYIYGMVNKVESGDSTNIESEAASKYFGYLFGKDFVRRNRDVINSSLNYGYALIRGLVARSIVNYGYMPCKGLFHHSQLNNYNLADDFIEPLRPLVDLWVVKFMVDQKEFLSPSKKSLYNIFNLAILIDGDKYSVTSAVDKMISSFSTAVQKNNSEFLKLPILLNNEWIDD
ncbi:MAG: type II CRISPR-associated endonuclease Cas1 [Desulfitobacteriaceae bacterium]|nr:type II CRISPR-associated endonuclease Cas1 [Desulfitobacteriaceae bacterium]